MLGQETQDEETVEKATDIEFASFEVVEYIDHWDEYYTYHG